jgi:hypothetical protein
MVYHRARVVMRHGEPQGRAQSDGENRVAPVWPLSMTAESSPRLYTKTVDSGELT